MNSFIQSVRKLRASYRFLISIGLSLLIFLFLPQDIQMASRIIIGSTSFTIFAGSLIWAVIIGAKADDLRRIAAKEDSSVPVIFILVLFLAFASLFTVVLLLGSVKDLSNARLTRHILVSILAVASSWILVHTIYVLHYARLYYSTLMDEEEILKDNDLPKRGMGGIDFPGDEDPDYMDFAYFSFVIGMTSQVSDVQVTSREMRRVVLAHGILSFVFNTFIVAISINIIAGLIQH